jgi:tRNA pseudouridine38-40 synthase
MRIAVKIGYDGSKFYGFAMQPDKRTVEGEILKMLKKTKIIKDRKEAKFQYAARTDRGVSAIGNVIAFNCKGNAIKVLQGIKDIWIIGYAYVNEDFNPRHCINKIYRYYLYDDGFDIEKLKEAAMLFKGEHDFSYFARIDARNPVRKIDKVSVKRRGRIIKIDFVGKSFLWNQIRRIMAAVIKAGKGEIGKEEIMDSLSKKRRINFGIAPAENLVLLDIKYDFEFYPLLTEEIFIKGEFFTDALSMYRNK